MNDPSFLQGVVAEYCKEPSRWMVRPLGTGNINDTYLLVQRAGACLVLQRINSRVFLQPLRVIENFERITHHLARKTSSASGRFEVASPVRTLNGASHCIDQSGGFWRAQTYIPHKSRRVVTNEKQARQIGAVLGYFHHQLSDLDGSELPDPLPGFHNLPLYLQDFDKFCSNMTPEMAGELQSCLETVEQYRAVAATLENAVQSDALQLQPVHGDPKVDNFLFDELLEPFGLLDLDTVRMGLVHHDLGDCLRSCCNRQGEAGGDSENIIFDLDICRTMLNGYFSANPGMSEEQRYYVFDAVLLLCFELGLRFLTDYLAGNRYFKIHSGKDNLLRAVRQFRLTADVAGKERQLRRIAISAAGG